MRRTSEGLSSPGGAESMDVECKVNGALFSHWTVESAITFRPKQLYNSLN